VDADHLKLLSIMRLFVLFKLPNGLWYRIFFLIGPILGGRDALSLVLMRAVLVAVLR